MGFFKSGQSLSNNFCDIPRKTHVNVGWRDEILIEILISLNFSVPDVAVLSDVMGQTVNPYEVAYFNGGADILDDIPVQSRDTTDQVVFRNNSTSKPTPAPQPSSLPYFTVGYNSYLG